MLVKALHLSSAWTITEGINLEVHSCVWDHDCSLVIKFHNSSNDFYWLILHHEFGISSLALVLISSTEVTHPVHARDGKIVLQYLNFLLVLQDKSFIRTSRCFHWRTENIRAHCVMWQPWLIYLVIIFLTEIKHELMLALVLRGHRVISCYPLLVKSHNSFSLMLFAGVSYSNSVFVVIWTEKGKFFILSMCQNVCCFTSFNNDALVVIIVLYWLYNLFYLYIHVSYIRTALMF